MKKEEQIVEVKNVLGLHIRPATMIAKYLQDVEADVTLTCEGHTVNAKSVMSILMLAAKKSAKIVIAGTGKDSKKVVAGLKELFQRSFEEKK